MAGERIMEALDLADAERAAFQEYEGKVTQVGSLEAAGIQPPPRNPILAAYDLEPEAYVLRVVEKISSAALHDALLVLPFGKVISLMCYLDLWAQKVSSPSMSLRYDL
jgi:U3 small nucleolar RNA-associated protein 12